MFWAQLLGTKEVKMAVQDLEGYDEVIQKFLDTLTPEQRLAGIPTEQRLLAMPDEMLRALPEDYLATLPEPVRAAIRRRLQR